jgi:hypothetical protein
MTIELALSARSAFKKPLKPSPQTPPDKANVRSAHGYLVFISHSCDGGRAWFRAFTSTYGSVLHPFTSPYRHWAAVMNAANSTLSLRDATKWPVLTVRRATSADGALLHALCEEHAQQVAHERWPFGRSRSDTLELAEALFETPTRAWAWIAYADGRPHGYAGATAGVSLLERGYYFQIESLFVRAGANAREAERQLFLRALRMARLLGCLNLQWRLPADQVQRLHAQLPVGCVRTASVHYVLPLETASHLREPSHA